MSSTMLHALGAPIRILLACGFTVLVACALGRWFLQACGAWGIFTRAERPVLAFAMGSAWLSSVVFALCAAQLVYKPVLVVAGAAALWIGLRGRGEPPAEALRGAQRRSPALAAVLGIAAACYLYLYLMNALAPEISPDGASYHLSLVARYLREHGFSRITTSIYAMLSQGMEMLFVFAFAFGRHSAAKVTHFTFLAATAAAMLLFGRRFRLGEGCAAVAAAFFAFSPVVGVDGTSSYNDCALALFTLLTFFLLLLWEEKQEASLLAPIGVAAGFCYAIKYTGFLAVPFALAWVLWKSRSWRAALPVALLASLFIAPWMVKDAIVIGNPVAPFFNRLFPNPYVHVSFEKLYTFFMRHYGGIAEHNWSDYRHVPWELAVAGAKLQGLLGPLFLLAPLGLWSLRQRMGRRLWAAAAIFALPWFSNVGTRFLIPSLVFVSLAMALAIWQAPRGVAAGLSILLIGAHAIGCWPSVISRWNHKQPWALKG
ncbi:MAG TPA: glycosyltransferase family 39 protein, partial [Bryobacterales bacterium]|nr:glycosyltransferase family 39 protein [Bryobacterales bacterium]